MIESIALYFGGLGFFFSGITGLSANLRQMTGQRFRVLLSRATDHPVRAGLLGVAAGALTQSTSVVAWVLSGMVATGLIRLQRALVVLACANIGTAGLVFVAAIDLHMPVLFLVGICGLMLGFNRFVRWKPGISVLLSIALVLFGLDLMKEAFGSLSATPGLQQAAHFFDRSPDAAFLLGTLMRSAVPSSSATAAITVTINKGGLLGEFPAMMSIAGIGIGAAIATFVLSGNFRGVSRQIAIYQSLTTAIGGIFLAGLLLVEHIARIPLLLWLANLITRSPAAEMAITYLILNLVIALTCLAGLKWAPDRLARLSPPTREEDLSRPKYLDADALHSPETAPDLVALEQLRSMRVLEEYLEAVRTGDGKLIKSLHNGAMALGQEITRFLQTLVEQPMATNLAEHLISFQRKEEILRALEENVFLFATTLERRGSDELSGRLVEALDAILLSTSDALKSSDPVDVDLLITMTDDRGNTMERVRTRYRLENPGRAGDVSSLHYATTLFERNVWLVRQLALWVREDVAMTVTRNGVDRDSINATGDSAPRRNGHAAKGDCTERGQYNTLTRHVQQRTT